MEIINCNDCHAADFFQSLIENEPTQANLHQCIEFYEVIHENAELESDSTGGADWSRYSEPEIARSLQAGRRMIKLWTDIKGEIAAPLEGSCENTHMCPKYTLIGGLITVYQIEKEFEDPTDY